MIIKLINPAHGTELYIDGQGSPYLGDWALTALCPHYIWQKGYTPCECRFKERGRIQSDPPGFTLSGCEVVRAKK